MRRSLCCAMILLGAGCNASLSAYDAGSPADPPTDGGTVEGDADTDVDADADSDADTDPGVEVDLDGLDPDFGSNGGGDPVTLTGGPFDPPVSVTFGGVPAVVTSSNATSVEVLVPASAAEGWVDVHVETATGASTSPLPFQYWVDGAGLNGALGMIEWDDLRGGYWDAASTDFGVAQVMFTAPTSENWASWLYAANLDSCALDYQGPQLSVYTPGTSTLTLRSGTTALTLPADPAYPFVYFSGDVPQSKFVAGNDYDLDPMTGNVDWPAFPVTAFTAVLPNAMSVTSPNIDGASPPTVGRSFTLQWAGPYSGDYVLVYLKRQRWDGAAWQDQEVVSCWLRDDGSYAIPNLWTAWDTSDDAVLTFVGRVRETTSAILPTNGAASRVAGAWWAVGFLDAN